MKIELEFTPEMAAAAIEGRKCCTFRRVKHGEVGDTFEIDGRIYRIVQIWPSWLADTIRRYYGAEGFESRADMEKWALKHYPNLSISGFVHFFAYVPRDGEVYAP